MQMIKVHKGRFFILAAGLALIAALTTMVLVATDQRVLGSDLPEDFAGYKVLFERTPQNTACLPDNVGRRFVLRASEDSVEAFLSGDGPDAIQSDMDLQGFGGVPFAVVGPGITKQQMIDVAERWNDSRARFGCQKLDHEILGNATRGFAIVQDTDAGDYTDDHAQTVYLVAPTIGNDQDAWSAFLNNVLTDEDDLVQSGLLFEGDGSGHVVWTDEEHGLQVQFFDLSYTAGHDFWFTDTYTSGTWWMCTKDTYYIESYECQSSPNTAGTTMIEDPNTSVFFENANKEENWYQGFTDPVEAYWAEIHLESGSQGLDWSSEGHHTAHDCGSGSYPPEDAISGTLVDAGTAYIHLSDVPLRCD